MKEERARSARSFLSGLEEIPCSMDSDLRRPVKGDFRSDVHGGYSVVTTIRGAFSACEQRMRRHLVLGFFPSYRERGLVKHGVSTKPMNSGEGVGDLNGDGRPDVLRPDAWFEGPTDPRQGEWIEPSWALGGKDGQVDPIPQILVSDVNGDDLPDVITGKRFMAHNGGDPDARGKLGSTGANSSAAPIPSGPGMRSPSIKVSARA